MITSKLPVAVIAAFAFSTFLQTTRGFAQHAPDDWSRFHFEGNHTFQAEQLLSALIAEPDFLLANHPKSNNADVHQVTQRLLVAGYQRAGFQSPSVQMETAEDGTVSIRIGEGMRQRCGSIQVKGAKQLDATALVDVLTKPKMDSQAFPLLTDGGDLKTARWVNPQGTVVLPSSPVWQPGKPAPWTTERQIEQSIKTAFESLGFRSANFRVSIEPTSQVPVVDLVIEILDEGEQDRFQTFKVTGTTASTPAQVLDFLKLEPGGVYDIFLQHKLNQLLYECGRFRKQLVKFERNSAGEGCLCIELTDVPGVPSLDEPLSDEADILLRARRWLSEYEQRGEDLVFLWGSDKAKLKVVQSQEGTFMQLETSPKEDDKAIGSNEAALNPNPSDPEPSEPRHSGGRTTLLVDAERVSLANSRAASVWTADVSGFEGVIRLETSLSAAEASDSFGTVNFNVTWKSQRLPDEPLLRQTLRLTPAGWCAFAYKKSAQVEKKEGKLILSHGSQTLEIDAETGRIDRFASGGSQVYQERGAFDRLRDEYLAECEGRQNAFDESKPITSLLQFCVSESGQLAVDGVRQSLGAESFAINRSLYSALDKLASAGLFLPLDAFAIHGREWARTERFFIPDQNAPPANFTVMGLRMVGKCVLKFLPDLFAEGTWPMNVTREACLVVLERGQHTGAVLQELVQERAPGPLRDAAIACLLSFANQPLAKTFANRALVTMEPTAFEKDREILLNGPCGKWVTGVLQGIGSLTEEEVESLEPLLKTESSRSILKSLYKYSKADNADQSLLYEATHKSLEIKMREIIRR